MHPIPFEFGPGSEAALVLFSLGGYGLVLGGLAVGAGIIFSRSPLLPIGAAVAALGIITLIVSFGIGESSSGGVSVQRAEAQAEIKDRYGLKLTESQVDALRYPVAAPGKSSKVYGSTELKLRSEEKSKPESQEVYLIWADGELQLAELQDGKSFVELPVAK